MTEGNDRLDAATPRRQLTLSDASTAATDVHGQPSAPSPVAREAMPAVDPILDQHDEALTRVAGIDPDRMHPDDLPKVVKRLRRARNRLEAVETRWLAAVARREAHKADGASSATTWARNELGSSWRDAKGQLESAEKLEGLPNAKGAFEDGEISGDAAAQIVKATSDERLAGRPGVEDQLVDAAKRGGPDLVRRTARKIKAALPDHERAAKEAADRHRDRYADVRVKGDGWVDIEASLDPVNGEAFLAAYRPLLRDMHTKGPGLERRNRRQRAADALGELGRRALAADQVPDSAGRPARVIVTTDLDTLRRTADVEANAQLLHSGPVCAETARRTACDANVVPIVLNGRSVPIDLGRTSRDASLGQRDCLLVRDRACRGCGAPAHLCAPHHCVHWADGGPTDMSNLVLLCYHCHQLVHEGGWHVRWRPDNTTVFSTPDGREIVRDPPPT